MCRLFTIAAAIVAATVLVAAPVPKEKVAKKDDDGIVGTWKIEKFETADPKDTPPQQLIDGIRFEFKAEGKMSMTVTGGPGGRAETREGTFKLDDAAKPKTIDMTIASEKEVMKGLYELDGDTFKLCIPNSPSGARPEKLEPAKEGRIPVVTMKRVVEEKEKKDK